MSSKSARKEAALALLGCVVGAGLTLFAAGRPWVDGKAVQGSLQAPLTVSGGSLAPVVPALALAALAGALAVLATRGLPRRLAGFAAAGCGIGVAVAGALQISPDDAALADRAGDALGTATAVATGGGTGWAWLAVVGGLMITGAGVAAAWHGPAWPAMSARYDKPVGTAVGGEPAARERTSEGDGALEQWRAMDRGEDPTLR
ncbi:MAG TPA: Trp biosynthesis-associated membrane protein [Sporichthya sp.]|nr:Trp biosynthesis-associated membrane protein [Sporichthya sp.]